MSAFVAADDPVLRQVAEPIEDLSLVPGLLERLLQALYESEEAGRPGVGIAAPQIGEPVRMFISESGLGGGVFVNPVVIRVGQETEILPEGCLSLPDDVEVDVERPTLVQITCTDEHGLRRVRTLAGLDARVALHEMDHLDGILITDRAVAEPDPLVPETV